MFVSSGQWAGQDHRVDICSADVLEDCTRDTEEFLKTCRGYERVAISRMDIELVLINDIWTKPLGQVV
jgi:hypothetical protein